jgi:predicted metal-dependent hydrolase
MDDRLAEGIRLFNARKFFAAHETLEAVWLKAQGEEKTFLHGLIQVAAAFHHQARHNTAGCRSLLEKGWTKLERLGARKNGVDLDGLRRGLESWWDFLDGRRREAPRLPKIRTCG